MEINRTPIPAPTGSTAGRRAARRLFLATTVALPLTLAACTPQTEPPPAPLPMPTVNTTTPESGPTSTPVSAPSATGQEVHVLPEEIEPPVPSDVALENSADGAEAYAYFLFQAWWYLINTHDIDWWDANIPDCEWKQILRDTAVRSSEKGIRSELASFNPYTESRKVNPENPSEFAITLHAQVGPIYQTSAGGERSTSTQPRVQELVARLLHDGTGWTAVAIVNRKAGESQ